MDITCSDDMEDDESDDDETDDGKSVSDGDGETDDD